MYRRGILRNLGVGGVALASGCLGSSGSPPRYLEELTLRNYGDDPNEFELTVERSGTVVQEATVELGPRAVLDRVDCDWSGRGPYVVSCTLGSDQTETVRVSDIQQGSGEYAHVVFDATLMGHLEWAGYLDDGGTRRCSE